MKRNRIVRGFVPLAAFAALALSACSNASGGGGEKQPNATDLAIAAAKTKYLAMAGTWTKVDSQGNTNTLVIDSEKATLTFAKDGDFKWYSGGVFYADVKTLQTGQYSELIEEWKGVSTLGQATQTAVSLHPDLSQDLNSAVSTLMTGTGSNFNLSDACLYEVITNKNNLPTRRNPYVRALALRKTSEGKIEAMFVSGALKDSSPVFSEVYSITFEKNSGGSSGGQSPSFSVVGSWKRQGETQSGRYLKINSDGSFNMYKNGSVYGLYTNCQATMNGSRITIKFKMSAAGNNVSVQDVFEVSGTASQMKWKLVSSETSTSSGTNTDTSSSAVLQNFFSVLANEMTFVPN